MRIVLVIAAVLIATPVGLCQSDRLPLNTSRTIIFSSDEDGGEIEDTTSVWRYFPLAVGNEWQYELFFPDTGATSHTGYRVRTDTLLEGHTYYALRYCYGAKNCTPPHNDTYVRFDTTNALLVERVLVGGQPHERWWDEVPCALDAPFGASQVTCTGLGGDPQYFVEGGYDYNLVLPPDTVRGITYKEFDWLESVIGVAADFGVISRLYWKAPRPIETLVYAKIDGAEYGTPSFSFPTSSQPALSPDSRELSIYPNPSHDIVTIQFDVATADGYRIDVFDVLGRRTIGIDLGILPSGQVRHRLDLGALAQGSYFVTIVSPSRSRYATKHLHIAR